MQWPYPADVDMVTGVTCRFRPAGRLNPALPSCTSYDLDAQSRNFATLLRALFRDCQSDLSQHQAQLCMPHELVRRGCVTHIISCACLPPLVALSIHESQFFEVRGSTNMNVMKLIMIYRKTASGNR